MGPLQLPELTLQGRKGLMRARRGSPQDLIWIEGALVNHEMRQLSEYVGMKKRIAECGPELGQHRYNRKTARSIVSQSCSGLEGAAVPLDL